MQLGASCANGDAWEPATAEWPIYQARDCLASEQVDVLGQRTVCRSENRMRGYISLESCWWAGGLGGGEAVLAANSQRLERIAEGDAARSEACRATSILRCVLTIDH
jgi:hypothetical protein